MADELIAVATGALIAQADAGQHTPSFPVGRRYLRLIVQKEVALPNQRPHAWPLKADRWTVRHVRRTAAELARTAGYQSLDLLTPEERLPYVEQAIGVLSSRAEARWRLRSLRQTIRELLTERGISVTHRAVELFVASHGDESPETLQESVARYLARPRHKA
jgi:hypothetical protein